MSFFDKLSGNKTLVLLGLGVAAVAGGVAYLVKSYNQQNQHSHENEPAFDLDLEIQKLKATINMQNPTLEDIKKILTFSLDASKKEIFKFSKNFKKDRKAYNHKKRNQNLDQYLRMVAQGMTQIQQIGMNLQQQIMMKIGISQQHFAKYQNQLGTFLQEQMMSQGLGSQNERELTLEEVKRAINLQIEYMQYHGNEMVDKLINTCSGWSQQQKALVPTLMGVYISDEVFQNHPQIDEDALQGAQMRFQHQLTELTKLQRVMAPIMEKLTQGLGFGGMGGMGMDMGMDMGMGGMDMGMGGMPSMEQLQQLRMQNPQAFEQLMMMMSNGMQQ